MEKQFLQLKNLLKIYNSGTAGEVKALRNLSLEAEEGEFITIIGSNAAGKTTLFNTIAGAMNLDSGEIILDNVPLGKLKEHQRAKFISRVRQNPNESVIRSMTLAENLSLAKCRASKITLQKGVKNEWREEFISILKTFNLGLEKRLDDPIDILSGGQKQVVALLMSIIIKPKLLLLDEHTAALDPKVSEMVLKITDELVKENHITTLMITHNISHAIKYGSRLILLDGGKVSYDVVGEEKRNLTVVEVIEKIEGKIAEFEEDLSI